MRLSSNAYDGGDFRSALDRCDRRRRITPPGPDWDDPLNPFYFRAITTSPTRITVSPRANRRCTSPAARIKQMYREAIELGQDGFGGFGPDKRFGTGIGARDKRWWRPAGAANL